MSTYTPITSFTLASAASSITFNSIPQNYTDLVLVTNWQASGGSVYMQCQVNGDTGSNYGRVALAATTSPVGIVQGSNPWAYVTTYAYLQNNEWGNTIINFNNYSQTNTFKTFITRGNSASIATEQVINTWRNTSAINSIYLQTNANSFGAGSTFSLYGIEAGSAKAQGGNIVTNDGTYWYHTFTTSGTFTPYSTISNVDFLVLAGGGGGQASNVNGLGMGGGGAGGYRTSLGTSGGGAGAESKLTLNAQNYIVTVGAGGIGGQSNTTLGTATNGSDSSFATITSLGGGRGGNQNGVAQSGGSGGGAPGAAAGQSAGSGTSGQGYAGGVGGASNVGGGGGGAGAVGQAGDAGGSGKAGNGGAGIASSISGISVTRGGGGGGSANDQIVGATGGTGGAGGGGNGTANNANGGNGTANLGGGGGASGNQAGSPSGTSGTGGNGGSGVVIVRYAV
jgi:hypothetical protein